ncbi:MAG: hydroxyacylglutathione hydrolase, partial [Alphaproteobacteria bacterium]|nr:hydroxyacylglutathione hydrolase [Alphaproteobacteria bacterium]
RMVEVESLRAAGRATIPSTIGLERETNPFLRPTSAELRKSLGMEDADVVEVFAETRRRKDVFK